ncbi:MAG: glycoside hydrolase family 32 protein, partial [Planctomycetes bacterium]|nr:glycoside hydrolase family 32 protein [Planctomycetota bacterium]
VIPGDLGNKNKPPSQWSHAVSPDLVHWREMPIAILPDKLGAIFSGSGVVDVANTAGFGTTDEKTLVLVYTSAGRPFSQSISYSNDRGRTWTRYEGNPVVPNQGLMTSERDPRVFWYEPTRKWVMVLYVKRGVARFFTSDDLKKWTHASDFTDRPFHECPDMFELPVDGDKTKTKWILHDAPFNYSVGTFDGKKFTPEAGPFRGDFGRNFYAAQTWTNTPGRCIQVAWMNGGRYPDMPFNQQMSFPCELTLRTFPEGIRLCREPVKEIEALRTKRHGFADKLLKPGDNLLKGIEGELFEITAEIELAGATSFGLRAGGEAIDYHVARKTLTAVGAKAVLEPIDQRIKLHVLLDRTSLETFANDGKLSMSSCFLADPEKRSLEIYTVGGDIHVVSLKVYELKSSWPEPGNAN